MLIGTSVPSHPIRNRPGLMMRTVGRYGFFSPTAGDRMVLLPSAPLARALSYVAASAPSSGPPTPPSVTSLPSRDLPEERRREDRRVQKWRRMLVPRQPGGDLGNWAVNPRKERKLASRVYKGVPDRWRSVAWWILIERRAGASFQQAGVAAAATTRDSGPLGMQYRVSTGLVGYKRREVLMRGFGR